jgi:hypothetical protein
MISGIKVLPEIFFKSLSGREPVREWLQGLDREDRAIIGTDIKTVEFGWPMGMPICRSAGRCWDIKICGRLGAGLQTAGSHGYFSLRMMAK